MEVFRTELHEVQNADFFYAAFEKSLRFYEYAPAGSSEQALCSKVLDSNFQDLQT